MVLDSSRGAAYIAWHSCVCHVHVRTVQWFGWADGDAMGAAAQDPGHPLASYPDLDPGQQPAQGLRVQIGLHSLHLGPGPDGAKIDSRRPKRPSVLLPLPRPWRQCWPGLWAMWPASAQKQDTAGSPSLVVAASRHGGVPKPPLFARPSHYAPALSIRLVESVNSGSLHSNWYVVCTVVGHSGRSDAFGAQPLSYTLPGSATGTPTRAHGKISPKLDSCCPARQSARRSCAATLYSPPPSCPPACC